MAPGTMIRMLAAVSCAAIVGCASLKGMVAKGPFVAVDKGVAKARIVVAKDAPPSTRYAAEELQRFLKEMSGAELAIVNDSEPVKAPEILVGRSSHLSATGGGKIPLDAFGKEEYIILRQGQFLVIAGGEPRGTLYGVYGLLEDHLGCRWFTPTVNRIPKKESIAFDQLNDRKKPVLEYREPFVYDCFDGDWAARNRANGNSDRLEAKHGGKVTYCGFVHTAEGLLPPAKYYDAHPEYYSLVKGKRLKENSQLCTTNDDVVRLVTEEVLRLMKANPDATVFSVSQNDRINYCECDKCTALANAEGSQMGPMLYLVNKVAAAAAKQFPDKLIDTLAYQYTRKPPRTMRPEPNVIIRLCSIECCFSHTFEKCDSELNKTFAQDVRDWGKICNRLWVWNYDTSFAEYFTPFPNLRVRGPNIRFYAQNNVKGIFEQDVYTTPNGELSPLSGYLNAKLLWNPDYDTDTAINEFLDGVYGAAAKPIRTYIDLLHDKVEKENLHMEIWIGPDHPLLNGVLDQANKLWDDAEAAVKDDAATLERVRAARLSIDYATIERERATGLSVYQIDQAKGTISLKPEFAARVKRFLDVAARNGVTTLREDKSGDINLYKKDLEALSDVAVMAPMPAKKVGKTKPGLSFKCYDGAWDAVPSFAKLKPAARGIAKTVSVEPGGKRGAYALDFKGYLRVPADGIYILYCVSNDGSKVFVDGKEVINNDGMHRATARSRAVSLKKGCHALEVAYFQAGGKQDLALMWEGPGIEKAPVPASALCHAGE